MRDKGGERGKGEESEERQMRATTNRTVVILCQKWKCLPKKRHKLVTYGKAAVK